MNINFQRIGVLHIVFIIIFFVTFLLLPAVSNASYLTNLSLGMENPDVKSLQQYLNNNGYTIAPSGPGSKGFETNYFGPATRAAVIRYQQANSIDPTGFVGPLTRAKLSSGSTGVVANFQTPATIYIPQPTSVFFTRDLYPGQEDSEVRTLQQFLNKNGYTVALSGLGSVGQETTTMGPATVRALKRYQQAKGITQTGIVGPLTRVSLNEMSRNTISFGMTESNKLQSPTPQVVESISVPNVPQTLTVEVIGKGKITSLPKGISCPSDCKEDYVPGTLVTLSAKPATGYSFSGWSGACIDTEKSCKVLMSDMKNVTATFVKKSTTSGGGGGGGSSTPKVSPLVVDITANPISVPYKGSSAIAWTSTNAVSCQTSDGQFGTQGSFITSPLIALTAYSVVCADVQGITKSDSVTVEVGSAPAPVIPTPLNTELPKVSVATNTSNFTLTTSNGVWENNPTSYTYAWLRDGVLISGASAQSYSTLTTLDAGKGLTSRVTAKNSTGSTDATSISVPIPIPPATGSLTITPTGCVISLGASTCTLSVAWSTTDAQAPNITQNGVSFSTSASSNGITRTLPYGTATFTLMNGVVTLSTKTATASCITGSTWNGTSCATTTTTNTTSGSVQVPAVTATPYCQEGVNMALFPNLTTPSPALPTDTGGSYTPAEVKKWRERMNANVYRAKGDVFPGSPDDFTQIMKSADAQVATPEPVIEMYLDWTNTTNPPATHARSFGFKSRDAAFMYLLTGNTTYRDAAKKTLLTFFSSTNNTQTFFDKACFRGLNSAWAPDAFWDHSIIISRLAVTYDYLRAGLTSTERLLIENGLRRYGYFFASHIDHGIGGLFPKRLDNDYSVRGRNADDTNASWPKYVTERFDTNNDCKIDANDSATFYDGYTAINQSGTPGYRLSVVSQYFNNRRSEEVTAMTLVGGTLSDKQLVDRSGRYIKEWLTYSVYPDYSEGEYNRNGDYCIPQQGRSYAAANYHAAIETAKILAKMGDSSLYNFSTTDGLYGTQVVSGPAKSLNGYVTAFFDLLSRKTNKYMHEPWKAVQEPREATHMGNVLTNYNGGTTILHTWHDLSMLPYIAHTNNTAWADIVMRKSGTGLPSLLTYTRTDSGIGARGYNGGNSDVGGIFPSVLFMYLPDQPRVSDTVSPVVSVAFPAVSTMFTVGATIPVVASVSDNVSISKVDLYANGSLVTSAIAPTTGTPTTGSTYSLPFNTTSYSPGTYTIAVVAKDHSGNQATSSRVVNLKTPSSWTYCSSQNATCSFSGTRNVLYGVSTSSEYTVKLVTTSTACTDTVFGDPAPTKGKSCWYENTSTPTAINGTCGNSNNQTLSTAPTTNLCTAGTASSVSGSGPWTWSCTGSNGGTTAMCSAQKTTTSGATTYSAPINITAGGTYTGNWESNDPAVPVIKISTTAPVTIQNCKIRGKGYLILGAVDGIDLTVRNCEAIGINPFITTVPQDRFISLYKPKRLVVENNYLENNRGISINGGGVSGLLSQVTIRYNKAKNLNGRYSDGNGGYVTKSSASQFVQFDKVVGARNVDIAWNEIIGEPYKSRTEDVINFYASSGASDSPILVHDNYIFWSGAHDPVNESFSGGGIITDGSTNEMLTNINRATSYIKVYSNQVIATTNYGIAVAVGNNNNFYNNVALSSGLLPNGTRIKSANVGAYVWDYLNSTTSRDNFYNNRMENNIVGWMRYDQVRNLWWFPNCETGKCLNNIGLSYNITLAHETAQYPAWLSKVKAQNITLGVTNNVPLPQIVSVATVQGSCGTSNGQGYSSAPTTNLCSSGANSTPVPSASGSGPWMWMCIGSNGGVNASCSTSASSVSSSPTPNPVNGSCGISNNSTLSSAPTTNLCSAGTASSVSGSGPWTWSCSGSNGGTTASCSAQKAVTITPTTVTNTTPSASTWTYCATQYGTCTFSGTRNVLYGVSTSSQYFIKSINATTPCTNNVFGDPAPGNGGKSCWYETVPVPVTSTWTYCANENGTCAFTGTRSVRYGDEATSRYVFKTFTNTVSCNNSTFGDPAVGAGKKCWYGSDNTTSLNSSIPTLATLTNSLANLVSTIQSSNKIQLNSRVQVTNGPVNVRIPANQTIVGKQATGSVGTIIEGPITAGGYTWWNINYDSGIDGWSAENYLKVSNQ